MPATGRMRRAGDDRGGRAGGRGRGARRRVSRGGLAFVLYALAEVFAFIGVGRAIGYGWASLLLVAVSVAGAYLLRFEGPRALRRLAAARGAPGRAPGDTATHVLRLVGGVLIALPGFVSAAVGAAMFLPPVRRVAGRAATGFVTNHLLSSSAAGVIFGPRRVRATTGRPDRRGETREGGGRRGGPAGGIPTDDGPIEGEIVDR